MKQLSAQDLVGMGKAVGVPAPILIDVREPWEVALAPLRVDGIETRLMPMNSIPACFGELDPTQPVVCFCHHGVRSAQVVAFLERHGFEAAYNLAGGIDAWSVQVDPRVPRY